MQSENLKDHFLRTNRICFLCTTRFSSEVLFVSADVSKIENFIAACPECFDNLKKNPSLAEERGLFFKN